jgi:release factor glutamine methyltransferase
MNLRDWLQYGERQLRLGPHPEKAHQDAEAFLIGILAQNRAWLLAHLEDSVPSREAGCYSSLLEQRASGQPVQYIQGACEFYGFPFRVTPDVLIPRPETEILVEKAILLARATDQPRILDIGTGSGAIAVALAKHVTGAHVVATDISRAALDIAKWNAGQNEVRDRICFLEGDLLEPVAGEQFAIVVSNPPYVAQHDRDSLPVEVRDFEPALALFAGEDGLAIYRKLIPAAFTALVAGGFVVLEIGYGQEDSVHTLLTSAGFAEIEFTRDLQGIPRVASARRASGPGAGRPETL